MYYKYSNSYKRCITAEKSSATLDAVLAYIYRKSGLLNRCGKYAESVIDGLLSLGFVKKVESRKGIFYFSTDKAKNFKAIDYAREYLLAFHNPEYRKDKKILVFDSEFPNGKSFVEAEEAIKKGYI